jgi:outer membrane protein OmpA-like peptidoglycan-associated protein
MEQEMSMKETTMKRALFAIAGLGLMGATLALPAVSDAPKAPPAKPVYVAHKPVCEDMTLSIYFPAYETMLSSYSVRALNAATNSLEGCAVTDIDVSVVSEEAHSDSELAQLSEARAAAVLEALSDRGVFAPRIETSFQQVNATAASAETQVEPMARRVDVKLDVKPIYGL